jgi:uncharacterized protein (DUF433 family)
MMTTTIAPITHIVIDEKGVARIAGSRSRVIDIVLDVRARGWSPEEIARQYPHLSLGKIHAALSYYHDHKAELDADLERRFQEVERMRAEAGESVLVKRLRAEGKL